MLLQMRMYICMVFVGQLFYSDVECISTLLTFERLIVMCQTVGSSSRATDEAQFSRIPKVQNAAGATPVVSGFDGDSRLILSCSATVVFLACINISTSRLIDVQVVTVRNA
jgi:hypothetical protein